VIADAARWNHNIELMRVVLDAVPPHAARALDVGCGEGIVSRRLAEQVPHVVGLDADEPSIALARQQGRGIEYVVGDILDPGLDLGTFDLVAAVTVLHQIDTEAALRRMAELTRPGGRVAVVGVARRRPLADLPWDAAGFVATRVVRWRRGVGEWHTPAPKTWPPPLDYRRTRQAVERALPDARWRRHVLFRWSVVWDKR
jgi:2-polyprenyl-3-methyl-5-hydroxy-6-metoxy-1,4-benzoquinol methylase